MAKDILDALRQAEDDASAREKAAKESAQKKIDDAKAQAKQMIIDAEKDADKEAEKQYESARIEGDNELAKARNVAATKCDIIKSKADKNREGVVKKAVEFVLN